MWGSARQPWLPYTATQTCPTQDGTLTAWTGDIKSANFGISETYSNNQRCSWNVLVSRGNRVRISIETFDIEPRTSQCWDYVKVFDGADESAPSLGEFCGTEFPSEITSTGRSIFLLFVTDNTNIYRGFWLTYTGVCSNAIDVPINGMGWVESPQYPDTYTAAITCDWTLQTQDGYRLDVDFESLNLTLTSDCTASSIQFYDGSSAADSKLGEFCGSESQPVSPLHDVSSTTNVLYLSFNGATEPAQGFRLAYSTEMLACTLSPCQNGGSCSNIDLDFNCDCAPGWAGKACHENIDECTPWPCGEHGTSCDDLMNGFNCSCIEGYEGVVCDIDINECVNHQCQNGATCMDGIGEYSCICSSGFMGALCSEDTDECLSSPCMNNGICTDEVNGFVCVCPGFTGAYCQTDIDECTSAPCQNDATCVDSINGYTCNCSDGYKGTHCEEDIDECASGPCQHGSTCSDEVNGYRCECVPGYDGLQCQNEIAECASSPCGVDGTCQDLVNAYACHCVQGFVGTNCETNIDECASGPCQHGSTCADEVNGYRCECVPGYDGLQCQNEIAECASSPCGVDGTCQDLVNAYACHCVQGFVGTNCETNFVECASGPCQHGSTCMDMVDGYQCTCLPGYNGTNCENDIDECSSNPCLHNASCYDGMDGYTCRCIEGFEGQLCQTDTDECTSAPCQNDATCVDSINGYTCNCSDGYKGTHCEEDIDECASGPCQHGSTCADEVNGYQCECVPGYDGLQCQNDINECSNDPCSNDGQCIDKVNAYGCRCMAGYIGINCQTDVNECSSNPCMNGGTCNDLVNKFKCRCAEDFIGDKCEAKVIKAICAGGPDGLEGSGLIWDDTDPGHTNLKPCPEGTNGNASRWCDFTAQWSNLDLSQCVSPAFAEISGKAELLKSGNASAADVLDLANSLQNITQTPGAQAGGGDSKQIYPGDMEVATNSLSLISEVASSVKDLDVGTAKDLTKACAGTINNMVDKSQLHAWKNTNNPEKVASSVTTMMNSTEAMANVVGRQQAKHLGSGNSDGTDDSSLTIKDKNIELEISVFLSNETSLQDAFMGRAGDEAGEDGLPQSSILLPEDLLDAANDGNTTSPGIVGVMKGKFTSVGELFSLASDGDKNESRKDYVNTDVLSVRVLGLSEDRFQNLETPVVLVFKHKEVVDADNTSCVFLNMSAGISDDRWSNVGCELQSSNETHTVCVCSHLTNFAILMDVHGSQSKLAEVHNTALSVLSYIGGTLSILGCFLSITIYKFFRLKSDRIRVHMHLAAAIATAQLIFLVGIERNEIMWVCKMIAVVLHYSLTAMFCWMLVEGIQLYLALVHVFGSSSHIKKYFLLGWGAPVIIVGISFGVFFKDYGAGAVCWMSQQMLLIVFVPTVAILITLNTAVLIIVLKVMMTSLTAKEKSKDSDTSQIKTGLKAALVLLPLLGLTWVFGFLSVNEYTLVFTYLFAICNSLQGLFFFIAHCVMNIEVKKAYERRYGRKKALHSMTTSSMAPFTSRSQTSASHKSDPSTTELMKCKSAISTVSATDAVIVNDIQCLIKHSDQANDEEKGLVKGAKVAMETIVSKDTNLRMNESNIA